MTTRVAWFNQLSPSLRQQLAALTASPSERVVLLESSYLSGDVHRVDPWWRWGVVFLGVFLAAGGGVGGLAALSLLLRGDALWPLKEGALLLAGGLTCCAGVTLALYGWRSVTEWRYGFQTGVLATPTHLVSVNKMVSVAEVPADGILATREKIMEISVRRGDRVKRKKIKRWVLQAGGVEVSFASPAALAEALEAYQGLRTRAQAAASRGERWPALPLEGWPALSQEMPSPADDPAVRGRSPSRRWVVALGGAAALLWGLLAPLGVAGAGLTRERGFRDELLAGLPLHGCDWYVERGGFLYKEELREACAAQLLKRARFESEGGRGYEARQLLELVQAEFPSRKHLKQVKKELEKVKGCQDEWGRCP